MGLGSPDSCSYLGVRRQGEKRTGRGKGKLGGDPCRLPASTQFSSDLPSVLTKGTETQSYFTDL